jgi:cyclic lactone autoinducer peptide
MKNLKKVILKYASSLAALALAIGVSTSTSACWFQFNQPQEPDALKAYAAKKKR